LILWIVYYHAALETSYATGKYFPSWLFSLI